MEIHPKPPIGEGNDFGVVDGRIGKYHPFLFPNELLRN
jgi:hypothetical protein